MSATFSPLDIIIPVILVLYFIAGLRSGFFTTLGTFIGLALGVCAAAWLIPLAVAAVGSKWGLITAIGILILCLTLGQWLGLIGGRSLRRVTDITPLKGVERFFGGVLNVAACACARGFDAHDAHRTPAAVQRRVEQLKDPLMDGREHPGWSAQRYRKYS